MSIDISIVIPTHNRPLSLIRCIDSLRRQNYPGDRFEVIIVDDGSTGDTESILGRYLRGAGFSLFAGYGTQEHNKREPGEGEKKTDRMALWSLGGINIKYFYQECKGPAAARNKGIELAEGEIIGFTDDDCVLDKEWINFTIAAHRDNPKAIAVGGNTISFSPKLTALVSQFLSICSIETYINGSKETIFFPTCNVSFKKNMLGDFRFDEEFPLPGGEDLEFFWRLFKSGHRFIWNKSIKIVHHRDDTLASFMKQAYIYGRGNLLVQYIHNDHPLLKELKTGRIYFWVSTVVNLMKIPRFSYLLGRRFIEENSIKSIYRMLSVYSYFVLHKVFYIAGNIVEYFRRNYRFQNNNSNVIIPNLLILDVTHRCNLACRMCDIWKTKEPDIDSSYIKKVLVSAKRLGIKEIALSGGEALLRSDIFDILEYASKLKINNLGILTNGILVKEYFDKLVPYLVNNTVSLVISFDSLKASVHNYIRNSPYAWQDTEFVLRKLSHLKSSSPNVNFNVITIILNQNLEELVDLAGFVKSLSANSLQFQPLLSNNLRMAERKKSPFWITPERLPVLDRMIDELVSFKRENPEFVKNSENNLSLVKKYYRGSISYKDVKCNSAGKTILMSNEGKFTTCFSAYGDIKKQSLMDVLCSKERQAASEEVKKCKWPCLLPCFCDEPL